MVQKGGILKYPIVGKHTSQKEGVCRIYFRALSEGLKKTPSQDPVFALYGEV